MATAAAHAEAHEVHDHKPSFFARWFLSTNHKDIGTLYLIFAIVAGIIGGGISGLMRAELMHPGIQYLPTWIGYLHHEAKFDDAMHFWNVLITAHQAFFTEEALRAIGTTTIANLDAFARTGAPVHAVTAPPAS